MDGETGQVVRVLEAWRQRLQMSHRQFAEHFLGRTETEWSHMRAGRREPSETFVRAARLKAAETDPLLLPALDDAFKADALARLTVA